ncbi:hypothetical protein QBC40DRAFT_32208 [Triangularia verruculosa]|uniref:Uncharacterized protein n=1 Tax=Triangularia verruculosa TaxID=2587418 RepID=A0AAN7AVU6_9PEZI|nr:hypothetical protein QBC40DRAFT_32208 [Triangularia verruculosa]
MSSSSRYPSTTSTDPSKYFYSSANLSSSSSSSSRPGQKSSPWKQQQQPSSQPPLKPTHPTTTTTAYPSDDFTLSMPGIDPLSFFLTPPTPVPYPSDDDTTMLDFDYFDYNAGITADDDDDQANTADSIRSVSPSSLAGFARPPTPPKSSSAVSSPSVSTPDLEFDYGSLGASPESDIVMDEYYRHRMMGGGYGGVPLLLKDFASGGGKNKKKNKFSAKGEGGRHWGHHHVWREPSPEVYSIEEEPGREEEMEGGGGGEGVVRKGKASRGVGGKSGRVKRVRFVLPGEEGGY